MKVVDGAINAAKRKPPKLKPSPKEFVWPGQHGDDAIAERIAGNLQALLNERQWKPSDLATRLYGTDKNGYSRNSQSVRRWIVGEHPIPNWLTASYIAEALEVPMSRLLEPGAKFDPNTRLVAARRVDRPAKGRAAPPEAVNGAEVKPAKKGNGGVWVLAEGVPVPTYTLTSDPQHPGHLKVVIEAVVPHPRAMAILHMLEHQAAEAEE